MSDAAMWVVTSRDADRLAARDDVERLAAEISVELHAMADALAARWERGLRRMVITLSAVMIATATAMVFLMWAAR